MIVLRVLKWAAIGLLALSVIFVATLYILASRSLPDYGVERAAPGLRAEVEIVRDSRAVPHIFARTEWDAYYALGFAHAQDRLWQMELGRRIAQGRLAELAPWWLLALAGSDDAAGLEAALLRADVTARALDMSGAAEKSMASLSPDTIRALEAYAAGVNAWLEVIDEEALGGGAPELLFLGATVEPWRPADSVAVLKVMSGLLSSSFAAELSRARFTIALGRERAEDLMPTGASWSRGDVGAAPRAPSDAAALVETNPFLKALALRFPFPFSSDGHRFAGASNAWAVSGARSATRAPILATDPHLPLFAPGLWYMARIEFGDGGVIGGTLPGVPAVLIGRNESIAWGATTLYADVGDFYVEQVNPENPDEYRAPGGWAPFERRTETIAIGGASAVEVEFLRTRHGPVLPLDWPMLAQVTPKDHVIALSWTALADDDTTMDAVIRLMRAKSVDAAMGLRDLVVAPPQMIVIADRTSIASYAVGRIPLRRADSLTYGRVPGSGWSPQNDWVGFMAAADLPSLRDPRSGVVATANNKPRTGPYPKHLGYDWPADYRIARLETLLGNRDFYTLNGFQSLQGDEGSAMAAAVLPLIAEPLWAGLDGETGLRREALALLRLWYGEGVEVPMDALRAEPLIFAAWTGALTRLLVIDELEGRLEGFEGPRPRFLERVFRDPDGVGARWCDNGRTPATESCADIASIALDDALAELTAAFGGDLSAWRWGRAHEAVHSHVAFGNTPLLDVLFTIRHEIGGGDHTLKRAKYLGYGPTPYRTVHAGGFRAVYDFADLDRSVFAIATGQSGHVLSRHFDDFTPLWRTGGYALLSLSRREAEAASVGVTRLTPADDAPAE